MNTFYLTTPLYYVNAQPHLGHTYTTLVADCIARYKKMQGYDVCFLTGTDEHGQKIERAAQAQGISGLELADRVTAQFQKVWSGYGVEYDRFIRTSQKHHYAGASEIFKRAYDNGFIYKGNYSGWYCVSCNLFAPESETAPDCEDCGRPTERVTEESYFFKLSAFQQKLLDYYQHPEFIMPPSRRNEVVSFVSGGLRDLSVSRTSVKWGIPVPVDQTHVIYVWFDALVGYLTGIGFGNKETMEDFNKYWPAQLQLVGKDIIRFHTVYWPAFLLAAGLEPPRQVFAHGWWLKDEAKMSKSKGNVINPTVLLEHFGSDAVRYFLLREVPFGLDGTFSYDALIQRVNSDLANDYGNLVSRTLALIAKHFENGMPYPSAVEVRTGGEKELEDAAAVTLRSYQEFMDQYAFSKALESVWDLLSRTNRYLNDNAPWALTADPEQRPRLATILYTSAEVVRLVTVLLAPVIPECTAQVWKQLGMNTPLRSESIADLKWGGLPLGSKLGELGPIFPRIEKKALLARLFPPEPAVERALPPSEKKESGDKTAELKKPEAAANAAPQPEGIVTAGKISIDDFVKVELRVGQVLAAERIQGADKLLKLQVDLGTERRQILAGIAKWYEPDSLIGKKIVVASNLEPRKMRGLESNGMLLAASLDNNSKPVLATFAEDVPNGARLK
jgi:methionyl-tRNA synthetase